MNAKSMISHLPSSDDLYSSPYRFVIMAVSLWLFFSIGVGIFVFSPITPVLLDGYGITRGFAGLLTGIVLGVQVLFALPASMLIGRVRLKLVITVALILLGTMSLCILSDDMFFILCTRVSFGLGVAILFPCTAPLLMAWFAPKELPLVNGLNITALTIGTTLTTVTVVTLSELLDWQAAVGLFGIIPVVGIGLWLGFGRVPEESEAKQGNLSMRNLRKVLQSRVALLTAFGDAGPFAQYTVLTTWLPTFYFEVHGLSLAAAGIVVGILPLMGMIVVPIAAVLSLRFTRRRPILIISGVLAGIAGFGTFVFAGTPVVYPALILAGIGSWLYLPSLMSIPMEQPNARPEEVSAIFAVIMSVGGGMTFLAPLVVGAVADSLGTYIPGFTIFAVFAWTLVISGVFLPESNVKPR